MDPSLIALFALAAFQVPSLQNSDTAAFASPAARALVDRAIARRRTMDSTVTDYQANIQYRLSVGFGRRRWARIPPAVVEEQLARVHWQAPNDLRVDVYARRLGARSDELELSSIFDRPWFAPRAVGDSLRIFSSDFPATGALHPLSPAGRAWYRYAITGGVGLTLPGGRTLRLIELEVTPRRTGPALIAGRFWIDSATADVARMTFRYVGTGLWVRVGDPSSRDAASARRLNAIANRVLGVNADLEYALQDGRHWMPYRQVIFGTARIPIISDLVIPFRATTVFDDYRINSGEPVRFTLPVDTATNRRLRRDSLRVARRGGEPGDPDSLRPWDYAGRWPGGRYELHRPSDDSLSRYSSWRTPLVLRNPTAEDERLRAIEASLASMAEALPEQLTGQPAHGLGYERLGDLFRYDRVQGLSLGLGYRVRVPVVRFTSLYGTVRYGLSDERVTGRLTLLSDAPGARFTFSGYRDVVSVDPFASVSIANSLNALFVAHDNADYALTTGGAVRVETSLGSGLDAAAGARFERYQSVGRLAQSAVNDALGGSGVFPLNPPVTTGNLGGAFVRLDGFGAVRWSVTADVLGNSREATARVFGEVRRSVGGRRGATFRLKAGLATERTFEQMLFRLGGVHTVRGFDYGFRRAPAFWAAQLDVSPFRGRLRPVLFLDGGQAARARELFDSRPLVAAGIGVSLLRGWLRFDFSVPISPDRGGKLRFDLIVQGVR